MGIAELASKRSKDPRTKHGACIIQSDTKRIISVGYNGLPRGLKDKECYWRKPEKHEYVVHAEENAIFNTNENLAGSTLYLYSSRGYYPCARCARGIIQKGIKIVVMKKAIKENSESYDWSYTKHMFKKCDVKIRILSVES